MPVVVFYVSAHGFGHWAQCAPVIDCLQRNDPDIRVCVRSSLPEAELARRLTRPVDYHPAPVDVGVIQHSAVEEDMAATRAALAAFHANWEQRVAAEAEWLSGQRAGLVVSDIAPLGLAAAHEAGVRSFALGSLDWHEIYRPFMPADDPIMRQIAEAYGRTECLLKLPLSMALSVFPRQRPIGLVGCRSTASPAAIAQRLPALASCRKRALIMFGGSGTPAFDVGRLADMEEWCFLVPAAGGPDRGWPANVHAFDAACVPIPDVMRAVDVVVCKPGYGTLAEAWLHQTPLCFVPRDGFPEYPFLRDWLLRQAPAVLLPMRSFVRGEWLPCLEQARRHARAYPPLPGDGAAQAVAAIADALQCRG